MSYAFQFEVPADPQFYGRVKAEIGDEPAKGLIAQLVVQQEGGLRHIGIWESKEDWDRFREERVDPAIGRVFAAAGVARTPPRPEEHELAVVDLILGD